MGQDHVIKSADGLQMLDRVRRICGNLPEVEEVIDGFGHTTFKAAGKSFIMMGEGEAGMGLSFKSDKETQHLLLQSDRYVKTPYIGHHGWVSISKDKPVDWDGLEGWLREAYLRAAPKRLVKQVLAAESTRSL